MSEEPLTKQIKTDILINIDQTSNDIIQILPADVAGSLIDSAVSLGEVESVVEDDLVVRADLVVEDATEAEVGLTTAGKIFRDEDGS